MRGIEVFLMALVIGAVCFAAAYGLVLSFHPRVRRRWRLAWDRLTGGDDLQRTDAATTAYWDGYEAGYRTGQDAGALRARLRGPQ